MGWSKNEWGLTAQQTKFIEEYICNGYKVGAAYAVAYNSPPENASSNGAKILSGDCIISGNEKNNYLKYDGVMFRVLGVYDIDGQGTLSVKIITDQTVEID